MQFLLSYYAKVLQTVTEDDIAINVQAFSCYVEQVHPPQGRQSTFSQSATISMFSSQICTGMLPAMSVPFNDRDFKAVKRPISVGRAPVRGFS